MNFKHHLLLVLFILFQSLVFAHNPQQSTLKLILSEENNFLNISLSQYGIEEALKKKYPNLELTTIEPNVFKELLIRYLKENIKISVDEEPLKIGSGVIKLGSHQTELKLKIEN